MNSISERVELLGKGLYAGIPDVLHLKSIPTSSELDYVGSEDFDKTMIEKILPQAVEEKINFYDLLEIDYQYICRCLRMLNYGPYLTVSNIFCDKCGKVSSGEYRVNLNTINCVPLPEGFTNELTVKASEFIEYDKDIKIKLLTIKEILTAYADPLFKQANGEVNRELARLCYSVKAIGSRTGFTPLEVKNIITHDLCAADFLLLKNAVSELTNYGLRAGGTTQCPNCGNMEATFIALADDRFFRPTVGDLKQWKLDRSARSDENNAGSKTKTV